jgi:hypothetical protein
MFGEERATWRKSCEDGAHKAEVWLLPPPSRCVGLRIVGFLDLTFTKKIVTLIEAAMIAVPTQVKVVAFCDYQALTGADAAGRTLIQEAVKKNKERFELLHYLVPSKFIALAVQVAGLWHGIPTKTWTSRALVELEFIRAGGK